jgi:hypothetical protein
MGTTPVFLLRVAVKCSLIQCLQKLYKAWLLWITRMNSGYVLMDRLRQTAKNVCKSKGKKGSGKKHSKFLRLVTSEGGLEGLREAVW